MVKFQKNVFEVITRVPSQTKKVGEILAKEILKTFSKKAIVLGLIGDLGGGKTTFLQGFAKGLGIKKKILSPTFIIIRKLQIPSSKNTKTKTLKFKNFYHIDCYRLQTPKEILNLGYKKIVSDPQNIVAIEWADRISTILPKDTLILNFKFIDLKTRQITIKQ
jgi:tRNA threonylcarbamoyladenosine biosynthesis protein TsaE